MQNISNFIVRESSLQEMANFGDYSGDFRLSSGDLEIQFKIWGLLDYLGELTALHSGSTTGEGGSFLKIHFSASSRLLGRLCDRVTGQTNI